jgi:hypothetical protein
LGERLGLALALGLGSDAVRAGATDLSARLGLACASK